MGRVGIAVGPDGCDHTLYVNGLPAYIRDETARLQRTAFAPVGDKHRLDLPLMPCKKDVEIDGPDEQSADARHRRHDRCVILNEGEHCTGSSR